jgi:hypothetical protein
MLSDLQIPNMYNYIISLWRLYNHDKAAQEYNDYYRSIEASFIPSIISTKESMQNVMKSINVLITYRRQFYFSICKGDLERGPLGTKKGNFICIF